MAFEVNGFTRYTVCKGLYFGGNEKAPHKMHVFLKFLKQK